MVRNRLFSLNRAWIHVCGNRAYSADFRVYWTSHLRTRHCFVQHNLIHRAGKLPLGAAAAADRRTSCVLGVRSGGISVRPAVMAAWSDAFGSSGGPDGALA